MSISGASDSFLSSPQGGQLLSYNGTTAKWVNRTVTAGGSSAVTSLTGNTVLYSADPDERGTADSTKTVIFITATEPTAMFAQDLWMRELEAPYVSSTEAWQQSLQTATNASPQNIYFIGTSTEYGASATGATPPKWLNSHPGQLRTAFATPYGNAGTGIVLANPVTRANPTWDPRFSYAGTITEQAPSGSTGLGLHKTACWILSAGSGNYVEFTSSATQFVVYTLATSGSTGVVRASIDGGASVTLRNTLSGGSPSIERQSGYHANHMVSVVPAGLLGTHTIRIWGDGGDVRLFGIAARTGNGRFIIHNASISGKSLGTIGAVNGSYNDEATGQFGLPIVDSIIKHGPGVAIISGLTNEWTGGTTLAVSQQRLEQVINRVKTINGVTPIINIQPQPSPTLQGGAMTYTQMVAMAHSVATSLNVPINNNQKLFANSTATDETTLYNQGNANGYFADPIHPNDSGATVQMNSWRSFLGL